MRCFFLLIALSLTCLAEDIRECHIIHTTDVHAQFQPRFEGNGGWLKAATVIRQLKQTIHEDHTLLIDTGDSTQGTIAASLSRGTVGIIPLKTLAFDAWIPGNHELNFGIPAFIGFMEELNSIALCANLAVKGHKPFTPWRIFTKNGVRVAVIGITSSFMKNWLLPDEANQLDVQSSADCLKRFLPDILANKPDAIVLATHQGWFRHDDTRGVNELNAVAAQFPEIDLILGAHTHRAVAGCLIGHRTWYVQPAAHAESVAHVTLNVDTEKHKVLSVSSVLHPVEPNTPPDDDLRKAVAPFTAREIAERKRPLEGRLAEAALARGTCAFSCATSELLAAAVAEAAGAQIAFCGRFTNKDIPTGPLQADILYKLIPYDNTIVTAELTLEELAEITEEQWRWRKNYSYSPPYGLRAAISKDGKCTILAVGNDSESLPNTPGQRFKTAFHNHTAAGSGRFVRLRKILEAKETRLTDTHISIRKALDEFLKKHSPVSITPLKWLTQQ